jgi:cell division protein ZapA
VGKVQIEVNQRQYLVGCDDGQEERVMALGRVLDGHVTQLAGSVGQISELKLMLMGALMVADELAELKDRMSASEAELVRLRAELAARDAGAVQDIQAAQTLSDAADRLHAISDRVASAARTG